VLRTSGRKTVVSDRAVIPLVALLLLALAGGVTIAFLMHPTITIQIGFGP
jgi:hypothetical protein